MQTDKFNLKKKKKKQDQEWRGEVFLLCNIRKSFSGSKVIMHAAWALKVQLSDLVFGILLLLACLQFLKKPGGITLTNSSILCILSKRCNFSCLQAEYLRIRIIRVVRVC
jgi:hypothetical protein